MNCKPGDLPVYICSRSFRREKKEAVVLYALLLRRALFMLFFCLSSIGEIPIGQPQGIGECHKFTMEGNGKFNEARPS
jgi:hypothetical protein